MKSLLLFIAVILLSVGLAAGPSLQTHTSGAENVHQGGQDVAVPHTKPHTNPGAEAEQDNGRSNRQWQHNWMGP